LALFISVPEGARIVFLAKVRGCGNDSAPKNRATHAKSQKYLLTPTADASTHPIADDMTG
jgi:hypothetical protein